MSGKYKDGIKLTCGLVTGSLIYVFDALVEGKVVAEMPDGKSVVCSYNTNRAVIVNVISSDGKSLEGDTYKLLHKSVTKKQFKSFKFNFYDTNSTLNDVQQLSMKVQEILFSLGYELHTDITKNSDGYMNTHANYMMVNSKGTIFVTNNTKTYDEWDCTLVDSSWMIPLPYQSQLF